MGGTRPETKVKEVGRGGGWRVKGLVTLGEHGCLISDLVGVGNAPTGWLESPWNYILPPRVSTFGI